MAEFRVTCEENEDGGVYRAWDAAGTLAGYMTWRQITPEERSLDHTKVEEAFSRGDGRREGETFTTASGLFFRCPLF